MRPKHTQRDLNHAQIRDELRQLGAVVWDLADVGGEVFDLLVCWRGRCLPVEVKQLGSESDLTEDEEGSIRRLSLVGVEVIIATNPEDVIERWLDPRWQVVDQDAVKALNAEIADAVDGAVKLTEFTSPTEHVKKCIRKLRDRVFRINDLWCEAVEFL